MIHSWFTTDLEAVALLHQKPLSLCGKVHLFRVLRDQRVEVSIVLLSDGIWKEKGYREGGRYVEEKGERDKRKDVGRERQGEGERVIVWCTSGIVH